MLKRIIICALAILVCATPIIFINNAISYIPFMAAIFIIILSFIYLRLLCHFLKFSEDSMQRSCQRGKDIEFNVNFVNKSPLVFLRIEASFYISDLFGGEDAIMPSTLTLMPFEKRDFGFNACFEHIGTYSAGLRRLVIYDLLGLFSHTIENPNRHEIDVIPKLFDVSRVDLSNVSVRESRRIFRPVITDDMDYAGVREYQWGDPLKAIHWKLSARTADGSYLTRLFETFGNPGVSIIIDTSSPEYDKESLMQIFDNIVESALSVNSFAREHGIDSELLYINKSSMRIKLHVLRKDNFRELISDLPRIEVGDGRVALDLLKEEGNSIHAQGNIAFCTAQLSEEIISSLIEIKLRQRNPILFLVIPTSLEGGQRRDFLAQLRRLDSAHISYYVVSDIEDLERAAA